MSVWHLVVSWPKWLLLLQLLTQSFLFTFHSWKVAPTWVGVVEWATCGPLLPQWCCFWWLSCHDAAWMENKQTNFISNGPMWVDNKVYVFWETCIGMHDGKQIILLAIQSGMIFCPGSTLMASSPSGATHGWLSMMVNLHGCPHVGQFMVSWSTSMAMMNLWHLSWPW